MRFITAFLFYKILISSYKIIDIEFCFVIIIPY
nr:MAG TPA: hypothetical protein [Ackermannviridae sp.]DAX41245.1 MAG TPA: hypothetical protein [Caudoviricetes sp.]